MTRYTFSSSRNSAGVTRTLGVLLVLSLGLNLYLLFFRGSGDRAPQTEEPADVGEVTEAVEAATPAVPDTLETDTEDTTETPVPIVGSFDRLEKLDFEVRGSLSQLFDNAVQGRQSVWLTAKTSRILMWCLDLHKDMRAGDEMALLYEPVGTEEVEIAALRYDSQKMDRLYRAYFYKPATDKWGSYWDATGNEVPARLKESPIQDYQQITAVLGDGRDHRGYDFRAPTGTPVLTPRAGSVLRTTWNFKYNGNSLEIRFEDGTIARYLHLEKLESSIQPGSKLTAGQQVATSGNTGRTNAPHLHYEVEQAGRVVDPLDYHGEVHRTLVGDELATFHKLVEQYDTALGVEPKPAE